MKIKGVLDFNTQDEISIIWVYIQIELQHTLYSTLIISDDHWTFGYAGAPEEEDLHVEC